LLPTAPQDFEVYDADGNTLGSIDSSVVVTNLAAHRRASARSPRSAARGPS
jgi:hypothetical protein